MNFGTDNKSSSDSHHGFTKLIEEELMNITKFLSLVGVGLLVGAHLPSPQGYVDRDKLGEYTTPKNLTIFPGCKGALSPEGDTYERAVSCQNALGLLSPLGIAPRYGIVRVPGRSFWNPDSYRLSLANETKVRASESPSRIYNSSWYDYYSSDEVLR